MKNLARWNALVDFLGSVLWGGAIGAGLVILVILIYPDKYDLVIPLLLIGIIIGAVIGLFRFANHIIAWRQVEELDVVKEYLGESYHEVATDVLRSNDGRRQLRMTTKNTPFSQDINFHFEVIDPESKIILEHRVNEKVVNVDLRGIGGSCLANVVAELQGVPKVMHSAGETPGSIDSHDSPDQLPWPRFLFIIDSTNGVFLLRLARDRRYAGDTWHQSIANAKRQAEFEFGDNIGEWRNVPIHVRDPVAFVLGQQ